jgi:hypothetical protein
MKDYRFLEATTTKYLIITIIFIILIVVGCFAFIIANNFTGVDTLATFIDAVFKTIAILVGVVWTLNRYYIGRIDVTKLRVVNSDVILVHYPQSRIDTSNLGLLIFRLDIFNEGMALIPKFDQYLEIWSVNPSSEGTNYKHLYRWPSEGMHDGGPIEPGSWAAINDAVSVPADIAAVRLYLEIQVPNEPNWKWHKTFEISQSTPYIGKTLCAV